jgi:hypothetical protein
VFVPTDISGLQLWLKADTGVIGGGAGQFTAASSQYLSIADNASLSTGDIDFTVAGWVYLDSLPATNNFFGTVTRWHTSGSPVHREYALITYDISGTVRFHFFVRNAADSDNASVVANTLGTPATGTWYFIVAWHDSVADTLNISVNDGVVDSQAHTGGVVDSAADFNIGAYTTSNYHSGRIDQVGLWKRVLTAAERTALYNSGNGAAYPDLTAALKTNLISYWELDEASGTRNDSHGTNHLTASASSPTLANGVSNGTVSDGDPVGQWTDQSGNGNHATQTTAAKKPLYKVSIVNGQPVVRFDGTNDYLATANVTIAQPITTFVVFQRTAALKASSHALLALTPTIVITPTPNGFTSLDAGTAWIDGTAWAASTFFLSTVVVNGASSVLYKNGASDATGNPGSAGWATEPIVVGSTDGTNNFLGGDVTEIIIYNSALSAGNRQQVENYLNAKYALY